MIPLELYSSSDFTKLTYLEARTEILMEIVTISNYKVLCIVTSSHNVVNVIVKC